MNAMVRWPQAPWLWPVRAQTWLWLSLACLGLGGDWLWQGEGDAALLWQQQQAQHDRVLKTIQSLQTNMRSTQQEITRMAQALVSPSVTSLPRLMQSFKTLAIDADVQVPVMTMRHASQPPQVQFEVRGRYVDVWRWWQQVQAESTALVLQQLAIVNEREQVHMQGLWQWVPTDAVTAASRLDAPPLGVLPHIGFDETAWLQAQRWQAQQTPSYVQWVVPEVKRKAQPLEQYDLRHLRYEGVIAQADKRRALVRVVDASAALHPLVLLAEGAYLGRDFGCLQAITPEHLLVREVVQNAQGEWAPRWVKLPLGRVVDAPPSPQSAS